MKKSKILKAILSPIIKGLAIFAIFGLAVYAYATVDWPDDQPNPVTGVVGQFIGLTTNSYDGNRGGYTSATALCSAQFAGSHICTSMEMINTYNHNPTLLSGATGRAWINNGAPAHSDTLSNDCKGWTFNQAAQGAFGRFGSVWYFSNTSPLPSNQALMQNCDVSLPFTCCL